MTKISKPLFALIFGVFLLHGCVSKQKSEEQSNTDTSKELSVPEKIAAAHGYENWNQIEEIQFSFNFEGGNRTFKRSWAWQPKTNTVQMQMDTVSYSYDRSQPLDSIARQVDRGFINDRYWILLPFNLIWDKEGYTYETQEKQVAPISADTLNRLTIVYKSEGGYTPGDAYDLFYDKDFVIREWIFRRGNQPEPGSISTWEDYKELSGLKLVTTHNYPNGNRLFISDLEVK